MRIEATYSDGKLEFDRPIRFRHARVRLRVEIPDTEVLPPDNEPGSDLDEYTLDMQRRLEAIRNAPLPPDADLPPLSDKQIERYEAFKMREDR